MHTDEYGITLSREVHISKKKIEEHSSNIRALEERHRMSSGDFLRKSALGELVDNPDFSAWRDQLAALERWEQRFKELNELYKAWR